MPSDRAGTVRGTIRGGLMGGRLPSPAIFRLGDRPEPDRSAPANQSSKLSKSAVDNQPCSRMEHDEANASDADAF